MQIRIGIHTFALTDRETHLLKEIHSGRLRLERHCTDSRSLDALKRHNLVISRPGRFRAPRTSAEIMKCRLSSVMMIRDDELYLSVFGLSAFHQVQTVERTAQAPAPDQPSASQSVPQVSDSNNKDQASLTSS